jgi:ubiquinol-cytochrome c reductase cytochrome c subunit
VVRVVEAVVERQTVLGLGGLVALGALGWAAIAGPLSGPAVPVRTAPQVAAAGANQVVGGDGAALFNANCAACHGVGGVGTDHGPALTNAGAAAVDFVLRTGRMPLPAPNEPVRRGRPSFADGDIRALVAYVSSLGPGATIPPVNVTDGTDIAAGRAAYVATCAACHGAGGSGDAVGGGAVAPPLLDTAPAQVGEAIRIGPGQMPAFAQDQVSDEQLGQIAAYLQFLKTSAASPGGEEVGGVGPVAEGFVGWLVYLGGLLLVTRWIERRRSH